MCSNSDIYFLWIIFCFSSSSFLFLICEAFVMMRARNALPMSPALLDSVGDHLQCGDLVRLASSCLGLKSAYTDNSPSDCRGLLRVKHIGGFGIGAYLPVSKLLQHACLLSPFAIQTVCIQREEAAILLLQFFKLHPSFPALRLVSLSCHERVVRPGKPDKICMTTPTCLGGCTHEALANLLWKAPALQLLSASKLADDSSKFFEMMPREHRGLLYAPCFSSDDHNYTLMDEDTEKIEAVLAGCTSLMCGYPSICAHRLRVCSARVLLDLSRLLKEPGAMSTKMLSLNIASDGRTNGMGTAIAELLATCPHLRKLTLNFNYNQHGEPDSQILSDLASALTPKSSVCSFKLTSCNIHTSDSVVLMRAIAQIVGKFASLSKLVLNLVPDLYGLRFGGAEPDELVYDESWRNGSAARSFISNFPPHNSVEIFALHAVDCCLAEIEGEGEAWANFMLLSFTSLKTFDLFFFSHEGLLLHSLP